MTLRNTILLVSGAVLAQAVVADSVSAALMKFEVIPAYAPKATESPSWSNYVFNAIAAIPMRRDLGDRTVDPTAYESVQGPVPADQMVYTPYPSWRGVADPTPRFEDPFRTEFGNRVHFGLHIVGAADWDFALADLSWALESDDAAGFFTQSGDFAETSYSPTRVGIDYGANGVKGGGDDNIISAGPGTQRVHELIFVGVGAGFLAFDPTADDNQSDINATLALLASGCPAAGGCVVNLRATYSLPDPAGGSVSADGSIEIDLVPEPAGYLAGGIGLLLLSVVTRRRVGIRY